VPGDQVFNSISFSNLSEKNIEEEGIVYISEGELFSSPKIVMWYQLNSLAYSMICEEDENRALVASTLPFLCKVVLSCDKLTQIQVISESKKTSQGASAELLLLHVEEVFTILQNYMPNGQLLFISSNFAKHIKKEVDSVMLK
jgi:hypothetical protein